MISRAGKHSFGLIGSGDDVYHSYGSNQGIVFGRDACVVIDSGFNNRTAREILSYVKRKQIYLVDSHYHSDHTFGNSVLVRAGGLVVSQLNCAHEMAKQSSELLKRYRKRSPRLAKMLEGVQVSLPTITYRKDLTIRLDNENTVDVVHPVPRAHTDGDSVVVAREDRIVFAGDIFWNKYHPNLEDADIEGQIRAMKWILDQDPKKIVPGHVKLATPTDMETSISYMEELRRNIDRPKRGTRPKDLIPPVSRRWKMRWLMDKYLDSLQNR